MLRYRTPKGTQDWTIEDQPYYRWIDTTIRNVAARYGFTPIDTPIIEQTELFTRGVGTGTDIVEKEMYSFETKGGDRLTIRPEFTAGIARAYIQNNMQHLSQPVKLYAIGPLLRYERPQKGRYRQHTQCSLEVIGSEDPALDAEMMALLRDFYKELKVEGLIFEINSIGCRKCRSVYIKEKLLPWLIKHQDIFGETDMMRLVKNPLRILDTKDPNVISILSKAPKLKNSLCEECKQHFKEVVRYLRLLRVKFKINDLLVRGFDYYTKTVFEVKSSILETSNNTLNGGGRYDDLIELLGGKPTPGIGTGIGFERVALAIKELNTQPQALEQTEIFAVWFDKATKEYALKVVNNLRKSELRAEIAYGDYQRSQRSQMRVTDKSGIRFMLICGPEELINDIVQVKDLYTGSQTPVPRKHLTRWLQKAKLNDVRKDTKQSRNPPL